MKRWAPVVIAGLLLVAASCGDPTIVVRVGNEAASQGAAQAVTEVRVQS